MARTPRRLTVTAGTGRLLGWLAFALVALAWWFTFAPTNIGGPASYVVVVGSSMEPGLHSGDLVVTRARPAYRAGEVLAFAVDGGQVIHRTLGQDAAGAWITQGDNRSTPDGWQVGDKDILGAEWLTIGGFSAPSSVIHQWWFAPTAAALTVFLLLMPSLRRRRSPETATWLSDHAHARRRGPRRTSDVILAWCCAGSFLVCAAAAVSAGHATSHIPLVPVVGAVFAFGGVLAWGGRCWGWWGGTRPERALLRLRSVLRAVDAFPAGAADGESAEVWGRALKPARSVRNIASFAQREQAPVMWLHVGSNHRLLAVGRRTALSLSLGDAPTDAAFTASRATRMRRAVRLPARAWGPVLLVLLALTLLHGDEAKQRVHFGTVSQVQTPVTESDARTYLLDLRR